VPFNAAPQRQHFPSCFKRSFIALSRTLFFVRQAEHSDFPGLSTGL